MSPAKRRRAVENVMERLEVSERRACQVLGTAALDTEKHGEAGCSHRTTCRTDDQARLSLWTLWVQENNGSAETRRIAGEPQASRKAMASGRAQSATKAAKAEEIVV